MTLFSPNQLVIDFNSENAGSDWLIVNDGVMGGLSEGQIMLTDSSVLYTGRISLRNNGGFSSLRGPVKDWDLLEYESVSITYRSQGQPFAFFMETSGIWYAPKYRAYFATDNDEWQTVTIPLLEFEETVVARKTGKTLSQSQLADIRRFGFINTGKYESDFELEIKEISFQ